MRWPVVFRNSGRWPVRDSMSVAVWAVQCYIKPFLIRPSFHLLILQRITESQTPRLKPSKTHHTGIQNSNNNNAAHHHRRHLPLATLRRARSRSPPTHPPTYNPRRVLNQHLSSPQNCEKADTVADPGNKYGQCVIDYGNGMGRIERPCTQVC